MAKIILKDGQISSSAGINIPGNLSISGNVIIGDNFTDTLTVNSVATFNDDVSVVDTISGSIGRFTVITSSAASISTLTASSAQFGNITKINNVNTSFPSSQGVSLTRLRNNGAGNLTWSSNSTFSTNSVVGPVVFDASVYERMSWIASFTGNITAQISNLSTGREIYLYVQNTIATSSRTLTIQASSTASTYMNVNCSRSGAAAVSSITLAAGSGAATIWVANIGGNIVGAIY
jgi:hypothetical protein